jgi:hypothetical protein
VVACLGLGSSKKYEDNEESRSMRVMDRVRGFGTKGRETLSDQLTSMWSATERMK